MTEDREFYIVNAETGESRGSVVIDPYDAELEAAAEEAHNNLVRSLIEAGGEIRELNDEKRRLVFALREAVEWLDYFLTTERGDIYYDEANEARCRAEYLLMELEDTE